MKKSEAKKYLKQEILSVLNEVSAINEADAQAYDEIADNLRDMAEKALSLGNKELAKQLTNIATFSDREQNKQVSGDNVTPEPEMIDVEDTNIEDLDVEEEPEDTKKKKVKEYLKTEILKTLR